MITVLEYLVIAAAIGAVVFFIAVFVFGRGEQMAPLDPRTSPAQLPETGVTASDIRSVKFSLALRGYRMSDVDWTLERVSGELDELRRENAALRVVAGSSTVGQRDRGDPGDQETGEGSLGSNDIFAEPVTREPMRTGGFAHFEEPLSRTPAGLDESAELLTLPEGLTAVPAPVQSPTRNQEPDQP